MVVRLLQDFRGVNSRVNSREDSKEMVNIFFLFLSFKEKTLKMSQEGEEYFEEEASNESEEDEELTAEQATSFLSLLLSLGGR